MTTVETDAIFTCEGDSESIDGSPLPSKRAEEAEISMQLAFTHYLILLNYRQGFTYCSYTDKAI